MCRKKEQIAVLKEDQIMECSMSGTNNLQRLRTADRLKYLKKFSDGTTRSEEKIDGFTKIIKSYLPDSELLKNDFFR